MTQPGGRDTGGNSPIVAAPTQAGQTAIVAIGGPVSGKAIVATGTGTGEALSLVGTAAKAPLFVTTSGEPTGTHAIGHLYVTAAGVLMICTVAGTPGTFTAVGSQS